MNELSLKDKRCYLLTGYAPGGMSHGRANEALNAFVEDSSCGLVLCHDHFVDDAGGFAIVAVETESQLNALYAAHPLADWDLKIHPLIFSADVLRFLYQLDFTLAVYRGQRLLPLVRDYEASEYKQRLDKNTGAGD